MSGASSRLTSLEIELLNDMELVGPNWLRLSSSPTIAGANLLNQRGFVELEVLLVRARLTEDGKACIDKINADKQFSSRRKP